MILTLFHKYVRYRDTGGTLLRRTSDINLAKVLESHL